MSSTGRYAPLLVADYETSYYIRISYFKFAMGVLMLPLSAFFFCIFYSLVYDFENATGTQCRAYNLLPSISAAVGTYSPQKEVWKFAILVHAAPRFMMCYLYRQYNEETLHRSSKFLKNVATFLHSIENFALLTLSVYDSSNYYPIHEKSFITFILTSEIYMVLLIYLHQFYRLHARNQSEVRGLKLKKILVVTNISMVMMATYYFIQHNASCPDYAYTKFALCEYMVVLSNMFFHITATYDFAGRDLVIHEGGLHLTSRQYF